MKTRYNYSPFGVTEETGEHSDNPFKYAGREHDETGVYYYRARYYSPETGRFMSEDPIGFAGGDVNFYAYVGNSPLNYVDPLGLYVWNGEAAYISGGYKKLGGGYMRVTLITYEGTNKISANYKISLFGATVGLPAGLSGFSFILDDDYWSPGGPDPCKMEGNVVLSSMTVAYRSMGYSIGAMKMGYGKAWLVGPAKGIDFSADLFIGKSKLINVMVDNYLE